MKLFLIAAMTFLAAPAAAMDYVKCEAMNKAAGRIRVSHSREWKALRRAYVDGWSTTCRGKYDAERTRCLDAYDSKHLEAHEQAIAELETAKDERLAKIQADYKAEGCY